MNDDHLFQLPKRTMSLLVLLAAAHSAGLIASILLIRRAVDEISAGRGAWVSSGTIRALIGVSLVLAVTHSLEYAVTESTGYNMVQRIRSRLYDHLTQLPPRSVLRTSRGALLLRFTGDLSALRTWISRGLARGIVSAVNVLAIIGLVFYLSVPIALMTVGILTVGTAMSALGGDRVRRSVQAVRWRRSLLASNVAEHIESLATVQLFGRTGGERSRFGSQNDDLTRALHRVVRERAGLRLLSSATASAALVGVVAVGSHEVSSGHASVGTIVAAIGALRLAAGPVRSLGQSHEYWQVAQVSKRKLRDFLARARQEDPIDALALHVRSGEIAVRDVTVAGALENVDVTAPGGQMLAIIGPNGAGKSTLVNVIVRLVVPDAGEVLIDGNPIAERRRRSLYHHLGMMSADLPLMRGTLRRNILYRFPDADAEEIQRVVVACRLDEIPRNGSDPLSLWLTEGGMNVSPGHRQRIALARAILGSPRILVLDEPTAYLDDASKEIVRRVISRYRGTVVLATNDSTDAALADQVCVLEGGRVVESLLGEEYRERVRKDRRVLAGRVQW
jgi:ATP-binding cassette subfamily B protein